MDSIAVPITVEEAKQYLDLEIIQDSEKSVKGKWVPKPYRCIVNEDTRFFMVVVWEDRKGKKVDGEYVKKIDEIGKLEIQRAIGQVDEVLRKRLIGHEQRSIANTVATVKPMLPSHSSIALIAADQAKRDKFVIKGSSQFSLGHIMALIHFIPGMQSAYTVYPAMVGDEVTIELDFVKYVDYLGTIGVEAMLAREVPGKRTIHEMVCAGYTVLLMMVKTINPKGQAGTGSTHLTQYLTKRISALCAVNPEMFEYVDPEKYIERFFDSGELCEVTKAMSSFPRLKSALFSCILMGDNPYLDHMNMIFSESSMTVFTVIHRFMTSPTITCLHITPSLFAEMKEFQKALDKLKANLGGSWRYYKLIEPNALITSQNKLKLLGQAALSWMMVQEDAGHSLKNLQGIKRLKKFEELAAKTVPDSCMKVDVETFENVTHGMKDGVPMPRICWESVAELVKSGEVML